MKITKKQLKRIIAEERSKLQRKEVQDFGSNSARQKELKEASGDDEMKLIESIIDLLFEAGVVRGGDSIYDEALYWVESVLTSELKELDAGVTDKFGRQR